MLSQPDAGEVRPWWRLLLTAVFLAALGVALFGTLHAVTIEPIWRSLVGGLPFSLVASLALTWMFAELRRASVLRRSLSHILAFGTLIWLSLLPTTLFGVISRLSGFHRQEGSLEVGLALVIAALTGAGLARGFRLPWRLQIAAAVLVVCLILVMAGPIPVSNGSRALLLFAGFLPLYILASAVLFAMDRLLRLGPGAALLRCVHLRTPPTREGR
jgi:hypothetical protein